MEQLLNRLLDSDNANREAAEGIITDMEKQPEQYMICLISVYVFVHADVLGAPYFYILVCEKSCLHFDSSKA